MTASRAQASLAPGVTISDGRLHDPVRGRSWPLNDTGSRILAALPATVDEAARSLSDGTGRPLPRAQAQTAQFLALLNSRLLVNLPSNELHRARQLLTVTLPTLLAGRLVPAVHVVQRRTHLDTSSAVRILVGTVRGLAHPVLRMSVVAALGLSAVFGALGVYDATVPLTMGAALGIGVLVHEAGHAVTLVGTPAALGVKGMRPFVLHPPQVGSTRTSLTAAAGPTAGLVLAALLLVPAHLLSSGPLALLALITASQGLGLTCLASDGRRACLAR